MILTQHFIDGLNAFEKNNIEIIDLSQKNIEYCLGCFLCWKRPPYTCVIKDDMDELINLFVKCDVIIWSFSLYHWGIPAKMKNFLDRTLPVYKPSYCEFTEGRFLPSFLENKKHVLISSCGYIWSHSYTAVYEMFESNFKKNIETIFFKGGTTLMSNYDFANKYLSRVTQSGREYSLFKSFLEDTRKFLLNIIYNEEEFYSSVIDYFNTKEE